MDVPALQALDLAIRRTLEYDKGRRDAIAAIRDAIIKRLDEAYPKDIRHWGLSKALDDVAEYELSLP